ncbi:30S ribosomal protein S18 [candidate division WOR-3 bacterium]|nr:30S ribosomal protein S18 [candidate division WOR-3 bacterium]
MKVCQLCKEKIDTIDYKEVEKLENFIMESGKILPRRITGLCSLHQRKVSKAIKTCKNSGLIPSVIEYYR